MTEELGYDGSRKAKRSKFKAQFGSRHSSHATHKVKATTSFNILCNSLQAKPVCQNLSVCCIFFSSFESDFHTRHRFCFSTNLVKNKERSCRLARGGIWNQTPRKILFQWFFFSTPQSLSKSK
jgi:hypothetical protein